MKWIHSLLFLLLVALPGCTVKKLHPDPSPIPQRIVPDNKFQVALVLGGGGSRGLAHVGVIEELQNAEIPIDLIVGTSAGGIVGALYADTQDIDYIKNILCPLKSSAILDYTLINSRYGFVTGYKLRDYLNKYLKSRTFEELKVPLIVVAADLYTGEVVTLGASELIPSVHASCAVPGMFRPVRLYGRYLIDGGILEPVPVQTARNNGAEIVIAVDISENLSEDLPKNIIDVMVRSFEICYLQLSNISMMSADVVIKPKIRRVGMFCDTKSDKDKLYLAGREAARNAIPYIKHLIEMKQKGVQNSYPIEEIQ